MDKICTKCGISKPEEEFGWNTRRHVLRRTQCKECKNAHDREYRKRIRAEKLPVWYNIRDSERRSKRYNQSRTDKIKYKFIKRVKNMYPCTDCGVNYPYYAMDFDHCRGKKRFGIASFSGRSMETIKNEMRKCDLVCANCHRARTHNRGGSIMGRGGKKNGAASR
jgi:hypothetical protein